METKAGGNGSFAASQAPLAIYRPSMEAYEPKTLQEARVLAKSYAESRLIPNISNENQALLIMSTGSELGIPATAALRSISVINGRPALSAQLKIALCIQRKDLCRFFRIVDSTDSTATYEAWRVGDDKPHSITFTIEDAKKAGLVKPDSNWMKYPRRMLRWRAGSELADMLFPEVVLGLPSAEDLIDDASLLPRQPVATLDAEIVEQPGAPAPRVSEEVAAPPAPERESMPALLARLGQQLAAAVTVADCDRVAREAQAALEKGSAEWESMKGAVKARKDALRGKAPEGQQAMPGVGERQPGEEG